jgi:CheY-like chemotaxis protein
MTSQGAILLVEDNEDDVFLMIRALGSAGIQNPVHVAEDGRAAIDYLSGTGPFQDRAAHPLPKVLFLDLQLPIKSGFDVLAWIRAQPHFESLPVVIVSSSDEPADLKRANDFHVDAYLVKPPLPSQLLELRAKLNWD